MRKNSLDQAKQNWDQLDTLSKREQYRLLLILTQHLSSKKLSDLIRKQKLSTIDGAMRSAAYWFRVQADAERAA
jgi:hypothetical protein